jgi:hypothetical protein
MSFRSADFRTLGQSGSGSAARTDHPKIVLYALVNHGKISHESARREPNKSSATDISKSWMHAGFAPDWSDGRRRPYVANPARFEQASARLCTNRLRRTTENQKGSLLKL